MFISKLYLKNFRGFENFNINFDNKMNIIIGDNGVGKTTIIEAIYALFITKSFLNVPEKKLINNNNKFFYLKGEVNNEKKKLSLEYYFSTLGKKLKIDNIEKKKLVITY